MSAEQHQNTSESETLARKFFVLTTLGVLAFVTAVFLVVRYMPSNDGLEVQTPTPPEQHLAVHR